MATWLLKFQVSGRFDSYGDAVQVPPGIGIWISPPLAKQFGIYYNEKRFLVYSEKWKQKGLAIKHGKIQ